MACSRPLESDGKTDLALATMHVLVVFVTTQDPKEMLYDSIFNLGSAQLPLWEFGSIYWSALAFSLADAAVM